MFCSLLLPYTPFNRNPILIFPNENLENYSRLEDRNQWDPSFIRLGTDGNYNILIGQRYSKVTPNGEVIIDDKRIFEPFNLTGNYHYSFIVDNDNNMHIVLNAFDTELDTVYHYYNDEGDFELQTIFQKKTYYIKLDNNGDPIPDMDPFIINRNYDLGYHIDLILGHDGYLHFLVKSSLADISGYGDNVSIYYSRLTTDGNVIVNFGDILDEPQSYSFDGMELIQDSEGYLQFIWRSLYGTPWYRFNTSGFLNNYSYFGPPDYSPPASFFSLPNELYDLLILQQEETLFCNVFPDGTLIEQASIPFPDESYGGIDGDGGWLKDYMDNQDNIHHMFSRRIYFEDQEYVTKLFYEKLTYEGEFIVPPFEEEIMSQFGEPPREVVADLNGNPAFIISNYQIHDTYFAWFDPDSVRIEIGENFDISESIISVPMIINCDQWDDLLPIQDFTFDIYFDHGRLSFDDVTFLEETGLMNIHAWEYLEDGTIQITVSDTTGQVFHSGQNPFAELTFINLENNQDVEPVILNRIYSAIDTLGYQLDFETNIQAILGGIPGDINNDLVTNILDIIILVNIMIDSIAPPLIQFWISDVNGDETLNILDIIQMIDIIHDQN
jgi:hypothetical protein